MMREFCFYLLIALIVCTQSNAETKFQIIASNVTESMKNLALGTALTAFETTTDPNLVATKLAEEFNEVYGHHWFCLIGPQGFVSHFDATDNTLLWFTYNNIQIILFKPIQSTPLDIISDARKLDRLNINIIKNEMDETMKENAILLTTLAVKSFNSFEKIATNITATFDKLYGQFWHCIVGPKGSHAEVKYVNGFYISFTIDDLEILIYRTNQPSLFEDQLSVIVRARTSKVMTIESVTGMDAVTRDGIIAIAKTGINQTVSYADLANYVRNTAAPKFGVGVWGVLVSTVNLSTESWNIVTKKLIYFIIGELRFVAFQQ